MPSVTTSLNDLTFNRNRSQTITESLDQIRVIIESEMEWPDRLGAAIRRRSKSITEALDRIRGVLQCGSENCEQLNVNRKLVRLFFRAIDAGDPMVLTEYVAEDYHDHNPQFPNLPPGLEGFTQGFKMSLLAWKDFRHEIEDQIAEGDIVVTRVNSYGTHIGEFLGFSATGIVVTMKGITVHRIADGKLVEHWSQVDAVGVIRQLQDASPLLNLRDAHDGTAPIPVICRIKGDLDSMLYHEPGGQWYDITDAKACFATVEAAEICGFKKARGSLNKSDEKSDGDFGESP